MHLKFSTRGILQLICNVSAGVLVSLTEYPYKCRLIIFLLRLTDNTCVTTFEIQTFDGKSIIC